MQDIGETPRLHFLLLLLMTLTAKRREGGREGGRADLSFLCVLAGRRREGDRGSGRLPNAERGETTVVVVVVVEQRWIRHQKRENQLATLSHHVRGLPVLLHD